MRKQAIVYALAITLLAACQPSKFEREFSCDTPMSFTKKKTYKDVLSHFEIDIPKDWKTELYYDEYQSTLYTADTTKQLRESYVIDVTWHQGELVFGDDFEKKVAENAIQIQQLIPVKWGYGDYLGKESYYLISTGKSSDLSWHYLQIYLKLNTDEYYTFTSKIYGSEQVNERICASFAVFNEISFLK